MSGSNHLFQYSHRLVCTALLKTEALWLQFQNLMLNTSWDIFKLFSLPLMLLFIHKVLCFWKQSDKNKLTQEFLPHFEQITFQSPAPTVSFGAACLRWPLGGSEVHLSDSDDLISPDGVNPAHLGVPAQKTNAMNYLVSEQRLLQLLVQFDFYSFTLKPFS